MAVTLSDAARDDMNDALDAAVGASGELILRTGSPPAAADDASTGTVLATLSLPSPAFAASSGGVMAKNGSWSGTGAAAAGGGTNIGHFELTNGTNVIGRGTVTATSGGGDLELDNISIANGQAISIDTFTYTAGND